MAGMFGKKTVVTKATTKKPTHQIVEVKGKGFAAMLAKFNKTKAEIKTLTATQKSIEGEIKSTCLENWIELYESKKKNPANIILKSEDGDATMFIVQKKYSGAVDEERAEDLRESYGEEFVEANDECLVNQDLLNKYGEQIEEMFMKHAKFMSEEEKMELFEMRTTFKITPDAIDEAFISGDGDVEKLVSDINPVLMLKASKV